MNGSEVMVVDDDQDIILLIEAVLQESDYKTVCLSNGEECLKRIKQNIPDILLLDIMMPHMDGKEVCRRLRSDPDTKLLKIATVSALTPNEIGEDFIKEMGIVATLTKPFSNSELLEIVRKI